MTPHNKLYEAAKKVVDRNYSIAQIYVNLDNLRDAITVYEQEQPEAIAGEKENGHLGKNTSIFSDKIYDSISSQQTSAKDKEIAELKEAISELIQVKDWKDKYGKDEHYLKAMPIAWENVRKLIQK